MKESILSLMLVIFLVSISYADVTHCVTISDEQDAVMSLVIVKDNNQFAVNPGEFQEGAKAWIQHSATWKANKMIDQLVRRHSDKQPDKISRGQREAIIRTVDLAKERNERRGQ